MSIRPIRRTIFTTGVLALAAALAATPLRAAPAHAATTAQPLNVVAIGDSYASGEGDIGSGWIDSACQRSAGAAPEQAASKLNAIRPVGFTSFACLGSVIDGGGGAQSLLGSGGQLSEVDPNGNDPVNALTISIGGNDIGFSTIVLACMVPLNDCSTDPTITTMLAGDLHNLGGYPQGSPRGIPGYLGELVNAINARSDIDNVFLTEYPDPTTGPGGFLCGSAQDPNFGGMQGISATDAEWAADAVIGPLNTALESAVSMGNSQSGTHAVWHYVTGISNSFFSYGYCNPGSRYINTLQDSEASQGDQNGTMHPDALGQQAIANVMYNNYVSLPLMSASVSASSAPAAETPSNFTVQALTFANKPIANAAILVDGNLVGYTDSSGVLNVNGYVFSTPGSHTIDAVAAGYPEARASLAVQTGPYNATSTPSPIPLGSIPALTLTASNSVTSQIVNGTFTLTSGSGTLTLQSGATASNVTVTKMYKTTTIIGPNGKPIQVKVLVCPTLTFQPASVAYASQYFSSLISCTE